MSHPVVEATVAVEINGTVYERDVAARRLLVHFIRDDCDLTGTHVGCDTGNCGAKRSLTCCATSRGRSWCIS